MLVLIIDNYPLYHDIYHQHKSEQIDGHIFTEKALGLRIVNSPELVWLPLSLIKIDKINKKQTQIQIPSWLWQKNEMGNYNFVGQN